MTFSMVSFMANTTDAEPRPLCVERDRGRGRGREIWRESEIDG